MEIKNEIVRGCDEEICGESNKNYKKSERFTYIVVIYTKKMYCFYNFIFFMNNHNVSLKIGCSY